MNLTFSTDILDYQALRAMAYTTFGGAEPGEVLVTAERIDSASADQWHEEWTRTADRVRETAASADESGNIRTANGAYFRAHNYYRVAEFFLPSDDDRRRMSSVLWSTSWKRDPNSTATGSHSSA